jgi:hypothetical protein
VDRCLAVGEVKSAHFPPFWGWGVARLDSPPMMGERRDPTGLGQPYKHREANKSMQQNFASLCVCWVCKIVLLGLQIALKCMCAEPIFIW